MIMNSCNRVWMATLLVSILASCGDTPHRGRYLTAEFLIGTDTFAEPVPLQEFSERPGSQSAESEFTGVLKLLSPDRHGALQAVHDPFDIVGQYSNSIAYLPAFEFEFVQRNADLVPIRRGVLRTEHPYWEYILQPGRVWKEPGDGAWSRAALPFSLQERVANCTHNGMLSWLFDRDGNVSRVAYQISSETCGYFKLDMWGAIPAAFEPGDVAGADAAIARLDKHRAARLPVRPIAMLAEDYPGVDPANIGAVDGVEAEEITVYGLLVDGVHYRSGCATRHGPYPFCDSLPLPSYSTAKSILAGLALMRMEKRHPGIVSQSVSSLVPECAAEQWGDVSLEDLLDMATGNYEESGYEVDEGSAAHVEFLEEESHAKRVDFACNHFERRGVPGTEWVYHTSDTYLLGTALANYVSQRHESGVDFYKHVIVEPMWNKLNLSPLLDDTKRTYGPGAQAFAGYGLTYEADDIVRIAHWLNTQNGELEGEQVFDERLFSGALQRSPDDRGLVPVYSSLRYNNSFWALNAAEAVGCSADMWVPFMSGYGGITVAMFPNDTVYYYFSDGYVHRWMSAAVETHKISRLCE